MDVNPSGIPVVIVAFPGTPLLEIAGPSDVFYHAGKVSIRLTEEKSAYELIVVSADGSDRVMTRSGIELACPVKFTDIKQPIDTLLIAGYSFENEDTGFIDFFNWLGFVYPKVRRMGSICVGTFALAKAGLLNGKKVTTHWDKEKRLHQRYPEINVDSSHFFLRDGNIYTSGGVSSGTDLALALVEEDYGRDIALAVARHLVLYLKRPGFQSQFGELLTEPDAGHGILTKLHEWMVHHLDKDLSVEQLALQSNMSPRNFARVFLKDTGMTPAKFVEKLRVEMARKLLQDTNLTIEQIVEKCGLGSMVSMRRVFLRNLMVTPSDYRRTFRTSLTEQVA